MAKQRMIVTDDQVLIDMDLLFNAIRDADGDWERVEEEMNVLLDTVTGMVNDEDFDDEDEEIDDTESSRATR
jgi:hypothetical protein